MKQHKSVLQLFVRSSFLQVLAVCVLVSLSECIQFFRTWERLNEQYLAEELRFLTLEGILEEGNFFNWFIIGSGIVTMFLIRTGRNAGGRQEYTLYRLQIEPKYVFLWQAVYNCCCYFIFWAVQVVVVFGLGLYFVRTADAELVTNQSLFLAFYRSDYLHALLPLEHVTGWIRNVTWFLALGSATAHDVYATRLGKHSIWMWLVLVFGYFNFAKGLEEASGFGLAIVLYAAVLLGINGVVLLEGKWTVDGE